MSSRWVLKHTWETHAVQIESGPWFPERDLRDAALQIRRFCQSISDIPAVRRFDEGFSCFPWDSLGHLKGHLKGLWIHMIHSKSQFTSSQCSKLEHGSIVSTDINSHVVTTFALRLQFVCKSSLTIKLHEWGLWRRLLRLLVHHHGHK